MNLKKKKKKKKKKQDQILDKAVCISFYVNAHGKGMNPVFFS